MKYIPFYKSHIPNKTINSINKVLKSGWITTGPKVKKFEAEFGKNIRSPHNIAVSSCTAALHLACLLSEFKSGDEVIVPSFTFCSAINALIHVGATPVFCDINEKTLCADPDDIQRKISDRTKGIVVVHYAGMPTDMDKVNALASKYNLVVIEDAAHALMTKYKGSYVGSGGNICCFSFYATKNITTSEGGMLTTKDKEIEKKARMMSNHGLSRHAWNRYSKEGNWKYEVIAPGYKYNMTDIQAVMGLDQLERVEKILQIRTKLAALYKKYLFDNPAILLPSEVPYADSQHAWHLFTIRLTNRARIDRDKLIKKLAEDGIGTSVHFIPNHLQPYYSKKGKISLPVTEKVYKTILSLPFFEDLTEKEIIYICGRIHKYTKNGI